MICISSCSTFCGCVAFGEAQTVGYAKDMGVDYDAFGLAETDAENYVGSLAGCAGNCDQLGKSLRDVAVELFDDFACGALDGFGLVAEEAGGADEVFEFGQGCFGHRLRGGKRRKSSGVTMLTRTSVHCAERMVATSSSQGER